MRIDFKNELTELNGELKRAESYLDCETIVLCNIKKHIVKGINIPAINRYMKNLLVYFEDGRVIYKGTMVAVNYKYAAAFLNTIIATPQWYDWIKTANE